MNADDLRAFEADIADHFDRGEVNGPIHLSDGNESELIEIFKGIKRTDYVFSTWRAHYHALLHGVDPELLRDEIIAGRSLNLKFPQYRFFTSAIVGGILPIACGVAAAIKRRDEETHVWCFVGDMASSTGAFHDAYAYASGHQLPVTFVIEDNGLSVTTPTLETWGESLHQATGKNVITYRYQSKWPHWGTRIGRAF